VVTLSAEVEAEAEMYEEEWEEEPRARPSKGWSTWVRLSPRRGESRPRPCEEASQEQVWPGREAELPVEAENVDREACEEE
jgi:hypothetical protein